MAVCLGCGSRKAHVTWSCSTIVVNEEPDVIVIERASRRTTVCPPPPEGCGQRRYQRIVDEGLAAKALPDRSRWEYRTRR